MYTYVCPGILRELFLARLTGHLVSSFSRGVGVPLFSLIPFPLNSRHPQLFTWCVPRLTVLRAYGDRTSYVVFLAPNSSVFSAFSPSCASRVLVLTQAHSHLQLCLQCLSLVSVECFQKHLNWITAFLTQATYQALSLDSLFPNFFSRNRTVCLTLHITVLWMHL